MHRYLKALFIAVMLAFACVSKSQALNTSQETDKVKASIITEVDHNNGQSFYALIKMEMKDGWHTYWKNPGEAGFPTEITWNGLNAEHINQTLPIKFEFEGMTQYGYDKTAYYKYKLTPFHGEKLDLSVRIRWLACREDCAPESATLKLSLSPADILQKSKQFIVENLKAEKDFPTAYQETIFLQQSETNIFLIILMAFAGGLILNFMPCVFPILSLKAISLVQGLHNYQRAKIEAFMYSCGVIISFLIIASLLVWLRGNGEGIGWGFQLQSPLFILLMLIIFVLIFLMLLDIINFHNPLINKIGRISFARKDFNAFITGFFAVLIASPCTAPFMGVAIGYALFKPAYIYYPIFFAMGAGYALPFMLVGLFPKALQNVLPKPGRWMLTLKKIFAMPILLTIIWLGWVLYAQTNGESSSDLKWKSFNKAEVAEMIEQKENVFIDFTAKWCITCLANEAVAINTNHFANLAKNKNIRLFKADWTNYDEEIADALKDYGRSSIPLYVYCQNGDCKILPQLITNDILQEELK